MLLVDIARIHALNFRNKEDAVKDAVNLTLCKNED